MERAELEEYLAEGLSLEQIGERVGKHLTTVAYWLRKHGLKPVHHERCAPKGGLSRATLQGLIGGGLTVAEMSEALGVDPTTISYWLRRHGLKTARMWVSSLPPEERPLELIRHCKAHGLTTFVRSGAGHYRCRRCRAERVVARRRTIKEILVREAGGQCRVCGYDRCLRALEFHHLDPSQKEFHPARGGVSRSLERVRAEAQKCVLLCSNCHAEVEEGILKLGA